MNVNKEILIFVNPTKYISLPVQQESLGFDRTKIFHDYFHRKTTKLNTYVLSTKCESDTEKKSI